MVGHFCSSGGGGVVGLFVSGGWWLGIFALLGVFAFPEVHTLFCFSRGSLTLEDSTLFCFSRDLLTVGDFSLFKTSFFFFVLRRPGREINLWDFV